MKDFFPGVGLALVACAVALITVHTLAAPAQYTLANAEENSRIQLGSRPDLLVANMDEGKLKKILH